MPNSTYGFAHLSQHSSPFADSALPSSWLLRLDPGAGIVGQILVAEGDTTNDPQIGGLAGGGLTGGFETTAGMCPQTNSMHQAVRVASLGAFPEPQVAPGPLCRVVRHNLT